MTEEPQRAPASCLNLSKAENAGDEDEEEKAEEKPGRGGAVDNQRGLSGAGFILMT